MKGTKEEYIEAWTSQAESFYRLAYCSDPELNSEVTACIKKLKEFRKLQIQRQVLRGETR